ncbi:hypothetical protein BDU57DRAFT_184164 [Ampelomyces quisqualis]|uniref:Uncharacterized protein n=1 Tax=Ampelomyces quisqualis TaxID=50730 RepID=A0A6A5QVX7_AMPQU|nr:hypothetical protein BDU57DRAFT_184164 [Ampelomyces quisqualis]
MRCLRGRRSYPYRPLGCRSLRVCDNSLCECTAGTADTFRYVFSGCRLQAFRHCPQRHAQCTPNSFAPCATSIFILSIPLFQHPFLCLPRPIILPLTARRRRLTPTNGVVSVWAMMGRHIGAAHYSHGRCTEQSRA